MKEVRIGGGEVTEMITRNERWEALDGRDQEGGRFDGCGGATADVESACASPAAGARLRRYEAHPRP